MSVVPADMALKGSDPFTAVYIPGVVSCSPFIGFFDRFSGRCHRIIMSTSEQDAHTSKGLS